MNLKPESLTMTHPRPWLPTSPNEPHTSLCVATTAVRRLKTLPAKWRVLITETCECYLLFSSVQSLSRVWLFATPWTAACQASLFITDSWTLVKLMSIESVMPSSHLILCHPLLSPSVFPSNRVFSKESVLHIRWPKFWSFSFSISPCKEYSGLISFRMDWFDLLAVKGLSRVFSNTTVQKHQGFSNQLSL